MKKFGTFLLGVVVGIALTLAAVYYLGTKVSEGVTEGTEELKKTKGIDGATFFDVPGEVMEYKSYQIFQTLDEGIGLAHAEGEHGSYFGPVVLIYLEGEVLYDEAVFKNKEGKQFRVVGTYKYKSKNDSWHTVPIISLI